MPDFVKQTIREGAEVWERVLVGDRPDTSITFEGKHYAIDDLTIVVNSGYDPNENVQSSFFQLRLQRDDNTSFFGVITLDSYLMGGKKHLATYLPTRIGQLSDLRSLAASQIGHVLGLTGGVPDLLSADGSSFIGRKATALFGRPIPVDKNCLCRWDGDFLPDGIMSTYNWDWRDNFLHPKMYDTSEPMWDFVTEIEVAALEDIGYTVDYTHARKNELGKYRSNEEYLPIR